MGDLDGKVLLVTGGSRGIGAATVRKAVEAGGEVILHYGQSHDAARALAEDVGTEHCHLISADLMDDVAIQQLWVDALAWRGRIDVLVNNAGVYEPINVDDDFATWQAAWARTLQINLMATAHLTREAIRTFRETGHKEGAIINVTSRAAFRGDTHFHAHYAASKGGMVALTSTVARGWGGDGIACYSVAPGWVDTEMARAGAEEVGWDYVLRDLPMGEMVPPDDIANTIVFLATGKARHASGSSININGASFPR